MSDVCFEDVKEFMYTDSKVPTSNHVVTPIGYVPLTLGDIISIEKHNSESKNFQELSEDPSTFNRDRFSGLTPREKRFIKRAQGLKAKEGRIPDVSTRRKILSDLDPRYGINGIYSLYEKLEHVTNRTFTFKLRKYLKKSS